MNILLLFAHFDRTLYLTVVTRGPGLVNRVNTINWSPATPNLIGWELFNLDLCIIIVKILLVIMFIKSRQHLMSCGMPSLPCKTSPIFLIKYPSYETFFARSIQTLPEARTEAATLNSQQPVDQCSICDKKSILLRLGKVECSECAKLVCKQCCSSQNTCKSCHLLR